MITLQDIITELVGIREAIDALEVKGNQNATYICYTYSKCNDLINALTETAKQIQNESNKEPEPEITTTEVGEEIGE